jgi:hypothetical protein
MRPVPVSVSMPVPGFRLSDSGRWQGRLQGRSESSSRGSDSGNEQAIRAAASVTANLAEGAGRCPLFLPPTNGSGDPT